MNTYLDSFHLVTNEFSVLFAAKHEASDDAEGCGS